MEELGEFQEWEVLGVVQSPVSLQTPRDFVEIEGDSEGVIRFDYFSLDSEKRYARTASERGDFCEEEVSVDSDNPSWVDPGSEPRYGDDANREMGFEGIGLARKNSGEFWSDSNSERSVSQKNDLGFGDHVRDKVGFEGSGETKGKEPKNMDFGEFWSDSGGDGSSPVKVENAEGDSGSVSGDYEPEFKPEGLNGSDSGSIVEVAAEGGEVIEGMGIISGEEVKAGEEGKRKIVWWKLPFELLKFCVFRVSPVWSFSLAAAMIGVVFLGRRLYKMKRKTRAIPHKVTVEDKVSQFMVRAARFNEAFSVVRRVPITLRPSLPAAAGVTPWPVMSLR